MKGFVVRTKYQLCQSCSLPLDSDSYGTNADGSKNTDYCKYCFDNGKFTQNCTMDEVIDLCVPYVMSITPGLSEETARTQLGKLFPTLKRWK